jgi:hypothetical protein
MNIGPAIPPEQLVTLEEVSSWFAGRGFCIAPSAIDYADQVRRSSWAKQALSKDHHVWVDLATPDGTVVSPGYGSGPTLAEAALSARRRWQEEQEHGYEPGPRRLP